MMKVNWKIRFKNKTWLAGFISQTVILIQALAAGLAGLGIVPINLEELDGTIATVLIVVNAILFYLTYLGIIVDPTTQSLDDSSRALNRDEPL